MSAHAQLSPSSAVRWMTCPGSVALCKDIPDTSSASADEGTMMHTVAAHCLAKGTDASGYIGVRGYDAKGIDVQLVKVRGSMNEARTLCNMANAEISDMGLMPEARSA